MPNASGIHAPKVAWHLFWMEKLDLSISTARKKFLASLQSGSAPEAVARSPAAKALVKPAEPC
jgi:hypothetical protein